MFAAISFLEISSSWRWRTFPSGCDLVTFLSHCFRIILISALIKQMLSVKSCVSVSSTKTYLRTCSVFPFGDPFGDSESKNALFNSFLSSSRSRCIFLGDFSSCCSVFAMNSFCAKASSLKHYGNLRDAQFQSACKQSTHAAMQP